MSVLSVQNIQETFVGKSLSRTASLQITSPGTTGYIADGEVAILTSTGAIATNTATYANSPFIQIVERVGNELVFSSKIFGNRVTAYRGRAGAQGQEQIYHIGYNGSAGSLDITSGLDFQLTVIENQDDMMWAEQKKKNVVNVPNNLVTTQLDLAKAIVKNQMKKYITDGSSITACMLNNAAAGAVTTQGTTLGVTHGSNLIVYGAAPAVSTVGTLLRIGVTGSTYQVTDPVYTIAGAGPVANSFYLDQPYAGPTNALLAATAHGYIATPGASYGVRFTGKSLPFRRDFFKFKRVAFTLQMSGYGATPLTKTQEALYGYGDGRLVLEEESFSKGFEGALNRMTVPLPLANEIFMADGSTSTSVSTAFGDAFTTAAALYDAITIEFFSQDQATVVAVPTMPQRFRQVSESSPVIQVES